MDPVQPGRSLLRRIFTSRLIRYPFYLFLILFLTFALIGMFVPDDDTFDTAQSLHSGTNPYRDLPADQDVALREVLFITGTLRDTFLPTSLPEEDDYEFLSRLLRSLETRDDISWTTLHETGAERTIMAIANRRRYFAAEPFGLTARFAKLHEHWYRLQREEGKPERWEAEHDTTFLPPLLKTRGLDGEGAVDSSTRGGVAELLLSAEQREEVDERYAEWRKDRDRKVSYLKIHPPAPIAWVPLPKKEGGIRAAWDEAMQGGAVEAGKRVADRLLVASPKWKPIYGDLLAEMVPIGWMAPGEEEMTSEELERWMEKFNKERERIDERRRKQKGGTRELEG
jgi:hypothetical protein